MYEELIDKKVVLVMEDGYKKVGVLEEVSATNFRLRYMDGRTAIVAISSVASIEEAKE